MKKLKKGLLLVLAVVLVLSVSSTAFAATVTAPNEVSYSGSCTSNFNTSNKIYLSTSAYSGWYGADDCNYTNQANWRSRIYSPLGACQNTANYWTSSDVSNGTIKYNPLNSNACYQNCYLNVRNTTGGTLTVRGSFGIVYP